MQVRATLLRLYLLIIIKYPIQRGLLSISQGKKQAERGTVICPRSQKGSAGITGWVSVDAARLAQILGFMNPRFYLVDVGVSTPVTWHRKTNLSRTEDTSCAPDLPTQLSVMLTQKNDLAT